MQDPKSSIADLLDAYLQNLPGARERLASMLRREVVEICERLLGEGLEESEDVAQDSLVAVFAYLDKRGEFSGNIGAFAATVARNRCLDILRRRRRWTDKTMIEDHEDEKSANPLDRILDEELRSNLAWAMEQLDEGCRKLLLQNYFQGKSIKWISRREASGNLQFIYYRRRRCLQKVGEILNLLEKDVE